MKVITKETRISEEKFSAPAPVKQTIYNKLIKMSMEGNKKSSTKRTDSLGQIIEMLWISYQ